METLGQKPWITDPYESNRSPESLYGYKGSKASFHKPVYITDQWGDHSRKSRSQDNYYTNVYDHQPYTKTSSNPRKTSWCLEELDIDPYPLLAGYYHQYLTPLKPHYNNSYTSSDQSPLKAKLCATSFKDLDPDPQNPGYRRKKITRDSKIGAYDYCNPGKHIMQPSMVKLAISHVPKVKNGEGPKGLLEYRTHRVEETLTRMAVVKGDLLDLLAVQFNAREILNDVYSHVQGGEYRDEREPKRIEFNGVKTGRSGGYGIKDDRPGSGERLRDGVVHDQRHGNTETSDKSRDWSQKDKNRSHDGYPQSGGYGTRDDRPGSGEQLRNGVVSGQNHGNERTSVKSSDWRENGEIQHSRDGGYTQNSTRINGKHGYEMKNGYIKQGDSRSGSNRPLSDMDSHIGKRVYESDTVQSQGSRQYKEGQSNKGLETERRMGYDHSGVSGDMATSDVSLRHNGHQSSSEPQLQPSYTKKSSTHPSERSTGSFKDLTMSKRFHEESTRSLQNGSQEDIDGRRHTKSSPGHTSESDSYFTAESQLGGEETRQKLQQSDIDLDERHHSAGVTEETMVKSGRTMSTGHPVNSIATNLSYETLQSKHSRAKSHHSHGKHMSNNRTCSCSCHSLLGISQHASDRGTEEVEDNSFTHSKTNSRYSGVYGTDVYDGSSHWDSKPYGSDQKVDNDMTLHPRRNTNSLLYQQANEGHLDRYSQNHHHWNPPVPGTVDNLMPDYLTFQSKSAPVFHKNSNHRRNDHRLHSHSHCGGTSPCCDYHGKVTRGSSRSPLVPYARGSSRLSSTPVSSDTDIRQTKERRKYKHYDLDLDSSALTLDDLLGEKPAPATSYLNRLALYGLHDGVKDRSLPVTAIWDQRHMGHRSLTSSSVHSTITPQGYSTTDDDCTGTRTRDTAPASRMTENLHAFIMPITNKPTERGSPYTSPTYQSSRVSLATGGSVSEMSQSAGTYTYKRKDSKPSFIIKPRRCFADEGSSGKFKASYDGEPAPSLQWERDGVPIEASEKYHMFEEEDFQYLEIQDVEKADKGTYSCVITNSLGTASISAELEVYAIRRKVEPKTTAGVLSTAKKFSAPGSGASLSSPAAVFTPKEAQPVSLKSTRQRGTANENPPVTMTTSSPSSARIRGSATEQPIKSSRLPDRQVDKLTNGSVKSSSESVVSKVASKFGQESNKSKDSGDYKSDRTMSSSNTSTLKANEPEMKAYEPVKSKVRSLRDTDIVGKEDENKNEIPARVTLEISDKGDIHKSDIEVRKLSSDRNEVQSTRSTTRTSVLNSGSRRQADSTTKDEGGLNSRTTTTTSTPGRTFGVGSDRMSSMKSRFEDKSIKSDVSNGSDRISSAKTRVDEKPIKAHVTNGSDRMSSAKSKFEEKPMKAEVVDERPPTSVSSITSQQRVGSSLNKLPDDEPVSSSRKTKSSKLRSLSKKFAEFEENDQEFFSPTKTKQPKDKDTFMFSEKSEDSVEKESLGSSSVLSTEDSGSMGEKVDPPNVEEKVKEPVINDKAEMEEMEKPEEVEPVSAKVEDVAEQPVVEHTPVKQQVKETKKTSVLKSPPITTKATTDTRSASGRKTADLKTSSVTKTFGSSKTPDSRVSSGNRAFGSRVSKMSQETTNTKTSTRASPESSSSTTKSRISPDSNRTTAKSKASSQSDTSKSSVRNRYQPQMSPATKRTTDSKTTTASSSPTKRTTGLRTGSAKGGTSTENLTGRRGAAGGKAPEVGAGLTDKEARDGEYVSLKCSFTGTPSPTVAWYCNGAVLKDSTEIKQQFDGQWATLKFKDVFPDDTGRYEAVATNKAGEARTACLLTVKEAKPPKAGPSFTRPLQDQSVNDGEELELSCEYTGNPEPELTWFHEGKVVEACKDFVVSCENGVASLKIVEVFPEDAGLYELVAVNEKGESKTVANLTVNEPTPEFVEKPAEPVAEVEKPSFKRGLQNMTVYDGEKVTLQVEVAGTLPIEVCWVHGQKEIAPDDNIYQVLSEDRLHRLIIPDVLPEDQGVWACEAYNNYGDVDTSCQLTVRGVSDKSATSSTYESHSKEEFDEQAISRDKNILAERKGKIRNENLNQPPKFILKPKSLNTDEGNGAKFVCEVVGNPVPQVVWRRDGADLSNTGRFKSWHDGWKYFFEITHTLVTDAGKYQCVAKSNQGEISCNIDLVVNKLESPAEISDFRSLLKSRPQLGKMESSRSSASESEAEQLDFRGVLTRHVKTKVKPKFVKELRDVRCQEGQALTLSCQVTGTPRPSITWMQGQKEIKESRFFKMSYEGEEACLHIAGVYPEDQGDYVCVAENEAGVAESLCDIDIDYSNTNTPRGMSSEPSGPPPAMEDLEPPFIEELSPENVSVLAGNSFTLNARFLGSQPLQVKWTRGKRVIESGDRFRVETTASTSLLMISDCKCADTGIYTMSLSNNNGNDSITASVTVQDFEDTSDVPERPVGQPVVSHIAAHSLSLAWSGPSYDGGSQVTHYKIELKATGSDDWKTVTEDSKHTSFHVGGLESDHEYVFRVYAANKHGFGDASLPSTPILTINRRPSLQAQEIRHANEAHRDEAVDEYSLSSPLSPLAMLAAQNQLTMEPRVVEISQKKFTDFYDIGEEIGKGRFGSVFTCRERSSGMQLAAKKIRVKGSEKAEVVREVEIMNELHHSKLLLLYDAFMASREMVLVMEHVAGGELFERIIDEDYILTEREAIHFMSQICKGLRFMHEKHILHLDLKPENILCITPNSNEIKIIDFGLARKFDPKNPTKVLFGTPEFVAPEVINYDQIGFETDMWSLGVVCYLLLSGLSPFLGDNEAETLANVTMATWDFDEGFDEISENAKKFIELLLVKNMSKRMKVNRALRHPWLSQDVTYMKAKRLSTQKHKHFLARRKWQKTGNAIRALGRMSNLQKAFSRQSSDVSTISNSSRSRNSSFASEASSVIDQSSLKIHQITPQQTLNHINGQTGSDHRGLLKSPDINSNEVPQKSSSVNIVPLTNEDTSQDVTSAVLSSQEEDNVTLDNVKFVTLMEDFKVYEGDSARFEVLLENFDERYAKVSWFKDEQEISQNRKFRIMQSNSGKCTLVIRNCELDDDALYSCKVSCSNQKLESCGELYVESSYCTSTHS